MAKVNTYLNFPGNTEEAFKFYKSVFGGDFEGGIMRFRDIPEAEGQPPVPDDAKDLIMHISLKILDGHFLMGTDAPQSMGFKVNFGNNVYISLSPDNRAETKRLFDSLKVGGTIEQELQDMFWGDYYGALKDRYGVQWMLNCNEKAS